VEGKCAHVTSQTGFNLLWVLQTGSRLNGSIVGLITRSTIVVVFLPQTTSHTRNRRTTSNAHYI